MARSKTPAVPVSRNPCISAIDLANLSSRIIIIIIEPGVFRDNRGHFLETYQADRYVEYGVPARFVQDNLSCSGRGVLRGLHYQIGQPQGKLVWVVQGEVFDVAVDIRRGSPTFGK